MHELNESHHESKRLSYFESENLAENSEDEIQIDKDTLIPAHKNCCSSQKNSCRYTQIKKTLNEITQSWKSFSEVQSKRHQKNLR